MPLEPGDSQETISHNIEEMEASGHSHEQSVAAALRNADEEKKKKQRQALAFYLLSQQYQ